jgi:hypothetical protein
MSQSIDACALLFHLTGEGCCTSCSEDANMGYPISEIESPAPKSRPWSDGRLWSSACCTHAGMEPDDDENRRTWWAILIRASRPRRGRTP